LPVIFARAKNNTNEIQSSKIKIKIIENQKSGFPLRSRSFFTAFSMFTIYFYKQLQPAHQLVGNKLSLFPGAAGCKILNPLN